MPVLDRNGRSVAYGDEGRGPGVVLLHGLLMDRSMWDAQVDALTDAYRVITPEAPGHGDSDPAEVGYSLDDWAGDVLALLDHLNIDRAVISGQSLGGATSLICSAQRPELVTGLAFIDASVQPESPEALPQYEAFLHIALTDGVGDDLAGMLLMILFSAEFATTPAGEAWKKKFVEADASGYHAMARAVFDRPDYAHMLAGVACPAIVIHGDEDIANPVERGEQIADALGAPLHRIPGAGHASPTERPEIVTPILREFLDGLR